MQRIIDGKWRISEISHVLDRPRENFEFLCQFRILEHEALGDGGLCVGCVPLPVAASGPLLDEGVVRRRNGDASWQAKRVDGGAPTRYGISLVKQRYGSEDVNSTLSRLELLQSLYASDTNRITYQGCPVKPVTDFRGVFRYGCRFPENTPEFGE